MYLSIDNLCVSLNSTFKIEGLSMHIDKGEMIGVIGPNGSGKTTLLRLIAGIIKPKTGNIKIGNKALNEIPIKKLACIRAYVPESIDMPFDYLVHEMVRLGRYPHLNIFSHTSDLDEKAILDAIELTDIKILYHRRFFTLSMGEKQRVMLAMAIAQQPEFLLLDEPISHLDIGHQLSFMSTLKKLNKNGITIISAMHELNIAAAFFDRLCLMDNGNVIMIQKPKHPDLINGIKTVFKLSDDRFIG